MSLGTAPLVAAIVEAQSRFRGTYAVTLQIWPQGEGQGESPTFVPASIEPSTLRRFRQRLSLRDNKLPDPQGVEHEIDLSPYDNLDPDRTLCMPCFTFEVDPSDLAAWKAFWRGHFSAFPPAGRSRRGGRRSTGTAGSSRAAS